MKENIGNLRKSYERGYLDVSSVGDNPLQLFREWFCEAQTNDAIDEANTMILSTVGLDGFPRARVVLLKEYSSEGFIFYTNYNSEKGKAIAKNPNIGLSFFWASLERQVIVKGVAELVSEGVSDNYFNSRPRGSQLSTVISNQSEVIPNRVSLEDELKRLEKILENKEIVRPKYWGGYLVRPVEIEFWQGRPNRLHDRIRCRLKGPDWIVERLAP